MEDDEEVREDTGALMTTSPSTKSEPTQHDSQQTMNECTGRHTLE